MAKRVSVQRLWYQNSIWLVFEKATMKCTLDNFMMTCRILGCFYLFIVVIVTYTTAVILPSNMTTVQVICWIFNQLRKTLPIVKIVYLIVYDIQAWNKFVDRYILVANGIKNEQAGNNTLQNMWAHKNCLNFSIFSPAIWFLRSRKIRRSELLSNVGFSCWKIPE